MIGTTVSHYRIIEKLGGGGMGIVYKAQDLKLDRFVALKFLPPELIRDPEAKERFVREAKAASSLDHANICTIHEVGETEDGQLFIAMACYEGETLKKKIERGPLKIDEATDLAIQIAQGLAEAQARAIVHRDVKPANIFVTENGVAKIVDFGLAKLTGQTKLTKTGSTLGTTAYMSPEQVRGEEVDARTDIWSLGVLLYEMITGQQPFKGEYENAVMYSILSAEPEPVTALRTGLPMEVERIISKCLERSPNDRYQHADELLVDLRRSQQEKVTAAGSAKAHAVRGKTGRSRRGLVPIAAILGVALIITSIWLIRGSLTREQERTEQSSIAQWENSIAVLPFKNISPDPQQEFFCDGITEQIITNLSQLPTLKVTARSSVMRFKESDKTVPDIGKLLSVNYVLEGSVRKSADRIRVTAQLIKASDGFHLWAKDYDRNLKEIFEVQDNISQEIASALMQKLSRNEIQEVKTLRSATADAYMYYLQGSYLSNRFDHVPAVETFRNAESMLKKCIELDTLYAPAFAELSYLYFNYQYSRATTDEGRKFYLKQQESASRKATELKPDLPEALFGKAWMHWARSETDELHKTVTQLLRRSPNHIRGNLLMGYTLRNKGLVHHSFQYFDKVTQLDPLEPWSYVGRGGADWMLGRIESAFSEYEKGLLLESDDAEALSFYISALLQARIGEKAAKLLARFKTLRSDYRIVMYESWLLALKGQANEAVRNLGKIPDSSYAKMVLDVLLGSTESAVSYLVERQKKEETDFSISRYLHLKSHPFYDPLRGNPRFQEVVEQERQKYALVLRHFGYEK